MQKFYLFFLLSLAAFGKDLSAQSNPGTGPLAVPKGWHLMDKEKDGQYGISLDKAYAFLESKKLKRKTVVVAVIDSGIDTLHEDLKEVLWKNPGEIPGNGIDDDRNGYIDDVNGWNFLGNSKGENVIKDSYEGARVFHGLRGKYEKETPDTAAMKPSEKQEYAMWKKAQDAIMGAAEEDEAPVNLFQLMQIVRAAKKNDSILAAALNKETYNGSDLNLFTPSSPSEKSAKSMMMYLFQANNMMEMSNKEFLEGLEEYLDKEQGKAEGKEKAPPAYRKEILTDDENNINDRSYGNNNLMVSLKAAEHGTHVSGIIAAKRNNGLGMEGITDQVQIMMVRAVPDGDEHDKDIALAIRYAVDNGAKIINMSFGKSFSPGKQWVDEAVRYAAEKGVLLVHAAGNDHKNVDSTDNFPNPVFLYDNYKPKNWITVGASSNGNESGEGFTASFSNYGKQQVDVFAPGSRIYSTFPGGNVYRSLDGTSMAAPVVAGTAALLLSYFPYLTPEQLKTALEQGAVNPQQKVLKPGTDENVELGELCRTGGLLNAYESAVIAAGLPQITNTRNTKSNFKPTLKNKKD